MHIFIDIETIPPQPEAEHKARIAETIKPPAQMTKAETIEAWQAGQGKYAGARDAVIDNAYRKLALDGTYGEVLSIAFESEHARTFAEIRETMSERELLVRFAANVKHISKGKHVMFVGHNVVFDIEFLWRRFVIHGIAPGFVLPFNGYHDRDYFCTMQRWCGRRDRISLHNLCEALGIDGKTDDIDGSKVYDAYLAGEYQRILDYNRDDVSKAMQLFYRMRFEEMPPPPLDVDADGIEI